MSDARWNDPREDDVRDRGDECQRVYEPRDRDDDPRDALMRDLDLPRGDERELVVDRERVYELDGDDSRTLGVVGTFRIVPEHDLDLPRDTLENLHDQRLVELVELGDSECGLTLTTEGRDLLDSRSVDRDREPSRAALELGRWTFPAPLGYLNAPKWSGRSLVHDPDRAELLKRAFEDLATGRYTRQEVIARATAAGLRSRKGLTLSPSELRAVDAKPDLHREDRKPGLRRFDTR